MQLVRKQISGHGYWYLVEKGRRNGVVTNVKTIYLGKADRVAQMLATAGEEAFPRSFRSREMGASAALWAEARELGLVELIDQVCGPRRADAAVSYGQLLVVAAIQRAVARRIAKSADQLRTWYEGCGLADLLPLPPAGLDARRVHEALSQLRARDLEQLEEAIVARMVGAHGLSTDCLAFDCTNFDSYARAGNPSRLLRRGHAKSKRGNLRVLGLALMVDAEDGVALLSFTYPGNRPDVKSFRSFLRRLRQRRRVLGSKAETTVVCDGGNISKEVVRQLERDHVGFVARLPSGHAREADALRTDELPEVTGRLAGEVRAKKLVTLVYGKRRTVVAVYSKAMHRAQLPGLRRDIDRASGDLQRLQRRLARQREGKNARHALTRAALSRHVAQALTREHMAELFSTTIGGTDAAPTLDYRFDERAWSRLEAYRLRRTAILTSRETWSAEQLVEVLREQSHAEDAFRQLKDPEWASAVPLRHRTDAMLRLHAFVSVLGFQLSTLVVRRLRRAGVQTTVGEALAQLAELRKARVSYGPSASPILRLLARQRELPPEMTPRQEAMVKALRLGQVLGLGPTRGRRKSPPLRPRSRPNAGQPGDCG